jgi:hypothetical protein
MRILVVLSLALSLALSSLAIAVVPAGAAGSARCTQDWRPAASAAYLTSTGAPTDPPQPLAPPPAPTYTPYHLFCDGHYITTLWRAPVNSVFESVRLAREIVAHAAYPTAHLGVNPARGSPDCRAGSGPSPTPRRCSSSTATVPTSTSSCGSRP